MAKNVGLSFGLTRLQIENITKARVKNITKARVKNIRKHK